MAKAVSIFGDAAQGSLFFEGLKIPPAPLGGVVVAIQHPSIAGRIRVTRSDLFQRDGVTPRIVFKRMRPTRVRNKNNQRLVADLGFNLQQVIDYINDEANRKANEIDFQKNGAVVGSGNTLNFTGGIENVSVSNDIATIAINQVGITTSGGYVGTGITLFDFRGSGVSTVTSIVGGATTIFFEGGSAGNPVTSGILTSSNNTLRLTLQDASTVDVDVTSLNSVSPVSLANSTSYFFLNSGNQLANNQHDKDNGVVFYGTPIRRGEELVFTVPGEDLHVGVWNGGNGVTGVGNVNNKSNWSTKWYFDNSESDWKSTTGTYRKTGVELNRDVHTEGGTYSIRYGYDSEKLELHEHTTAFSWLISSANAGVGTTQAYIYFSSEDQTQASTPGSLPTVSQVRASEWTLESYVTTPTDTVIHSGFNDDDIWKSTRSLRPGMKLKTTLSSDTKIHHWGVGYGGTTGQGNGPLNPYSNATGSWRSSNSTELRAEENSTINNSYTAAVDTSTNSTLDLSGRNISWRYNSNNSWDVFDEDTDEVILTGDTNLDGNDMYPYLFGASTINTYATEIPQWEWDWNQAEWFLEHRDWESGYAQTTALDLKAKSKPMKTAAAGLLDSGGGFMHMANSRFNITWGEKMRPGQEFIWTQLTANNNGSSKNNMIIGVLNSTFNGYSAGIRFNRSGTVKNQVDQDSGFTLSAGISDSTTTAGASMRLQYEYGTNKLVCYKVESGVRTKLGESTSALDGNPIFISLGGDSTRMPASTTGVQIYGWEIAHEPINYYNPWKNWRIGSFPENVTGIGPGIHTNGNVLAWAADQAWRHKDGIPAGYKMHWLLPTSHPNAQIGQWSSSNASSGLTNIENNDTYWDWSFQSNTSEEIDALKGFTYNTSNSNYSATKWSDPNPGSTKFSIRYHSNNTIDLFDESNSEIIATKDVNGDGNPIYITWAGGGATTTQSAMQDDFFGGGDVGIALTTTAV
jgi:hypothetical protein|tara:strand:+ start:592 stop:3501 length:2910 start_codon:yes stop_codon:yes gene_type:complete